MEWTTQSRNQNITIRITKTEKREFTNLARLNRVSESNWAYHILKKHKHSYGITENIDQLLASLEIVIKSYEFILEVFKSQIMKSHNPLSVEHADLVILKSKINIRLSKILKLKNQITDSKLS